MITLIESYIECVRAHFHALVLNYFVVVKYVWKKVGDKELNEVRENNEWFARCCKGNSKLYQSENYTNLMLLTTKELYSGPAITGPALVGFTHFFSVCVWLSFCVKCY
jgi:hypothetical protein